MNNKLMLIDGNSIISRAFYALPVLTNNNGEYTNAIYGFMNTFLKFYDEEKPDYIAVAFDVHAKTFRHLKYEEYKAGRKKTPEELILQFPVLKNLLHKMKIKTVEAEGFEADDLIGTLTRKAENLGIGVCIVSGDKDLLQLAGDDTLIRMPVTIAGKTDTKNYYAKDVIEQIGVTPQEYLEVKALMGDASDNIPGVPGIGDKTAVKIIKEYKTIEKAIAYAYEIKPAKAAKNLKEYADSARLSKELSQICFDAPIELDLEAMSAKDLFNEEAAAEITRLGLKSLARRFKTTVTDEELKWYGLK